MIPEEIAEKTRSLLSSLEEETELVYFGNGKVKEFLEEISALSEKIKIREGSEEEKKRCEIKIEPAFAVKGKAKGCVVFSGIPMGFEYSSFIQTLIDVSTGKPQISEEIKREIESIEKKVHIRVFVTPTCPYCPLAVRNAHIMAILNENVIGEMIESTMFLEEARKYNVSGVPKTIFNELIEVLGAAPITKFIEAAKKAEKA